MIQKDQKQQAQRMFTASEVAEFEYCPLVWWYEQFEPASKADTEELFAHMVELEHDYGSKAPEVPEYQMIEQLLVRRDAFEEGRQQHQEHADEVAEIEEERSSTLTASTISRQFVLIAAIIIVVAVMLIIASFILR